MPYDYFQSYIQLGALFIIQLSVNYPKSQFEDQEEILMIITRDWRDYLLQI